MKLLYCARCTTPLMSAATVFVCPVLRGLRTVNAARAFPSSLIYPAYPSKR